MLSDPEDVVEGIMGYLLVNIAVLGPADQVTVHDSAFIKDPVINSSNLADDYGGYGNDAKAKIDRLRHFNINL